MSKFVGHFKCEFCLEDFEKEVHSSAKKMPRFCSKSCGSKWLHANGKKCTLNSKTTYEWWIEKHGQEEADRRFSAWRQKISERTSGENNAMFGKHAHTHGLKKYAFEKTGKSLEQIHGVELAKDIKHRVSVSMTGENNPAYGKVYPNAGRSVKGHYKGIFFRSLFEYSFLKHLESIGVELTDVKCESFRIPYAEGRTYIPDFYVPEHKTVYEVKPSSWHTNTTVIAKCEAAKRFLAEKGLEFKMVTELDFPKIRFDEARKDPNVVWKEKSFEHFKK